MAPKTPDPNSLGPAGPARHSEGLKAHRERIVYTMGLAALVVVVPFAINNFFQGRPLVGAAILVAIAAFVVDMVAIQRRKKPPIPFWALIFPMAGAMALATMLQGIYGAFWSYPLVLYCYVVLSLRAANIASTLVLGGTTALVYVNIAPGMAVRIFATLVLTILLVNIVLRVLLDLERKLVEQAVTDPLTGAYNRRYMEMRLEDVIERHKRSGAPASLLLVDLDRFKRINDELGHHAGDEVLKGTVALMRGRSRKIDLLFRTGGEEFILLLPDTVEAQALVAAEHVRSLIAEAALAERQVTVSIGVAQHRDGESMDEWLRRADAALYWAKNNGRNRVSARPGEATFQS